jgi:uncharacterized protein YndB with AHSA1/START domain
MTQAHNPNAVISTERVFHVPPRKIFAAFEQPDQLVHWWGPKDFTNTFGQFEFKPGGRWVLASRTCFSGVIGSTRSVAFNVWPGEVA